MHSKRTITLMAALLISILLAMLFATPQQQAQARPNPNSAATMLAGLATSQARANNRRATQRARTEAELARSLGVSNAKATRNAIRGATVQARLAATRKAKSAATSRARSAATSRARERQRER